MPRDLFRRDPKDDAPLTASPESQNSMATDPAGHNEFTIYRGDDGVGFNVSRHAKVDSRDLSDLHPYVQTLSLSDLESCVALESATFPEPERCSREKFMYRLTTCPELSLGLFSTSGPDGPAASLPTYSHSRPPDSASPTQRSTLVAQVIATKCISTTVTDESMEYPSNWRSQMSLSERQGHQEHGRTIAIHSLAALPEFRGRGLGKIVMRSYMQRMETSGIADRIVLLAHGHLVKYYEALGFRNTGKSEAKFGGGDWYNMLWNISEQRPGS
ncbi:MAG: hypothetical protein L6R40_002158 [Gallowayella cf. fulva]|nr:MAG: hypothetical protein L6R40_002158 [Xanthomendoza cf. fulva]